MKKSLFLIAFLILASSAWAGPDQVNIREIRDGVNDGQITTKATQLYSANISFKGVTAGDTFTFFDSATVAETNPVLKVVAPAANGSIAIKFSPTTAYFQNGIYAHSNKTGGNFTADIQIAN